MSLWKDLTRSSYEPFYTAAIFPARLSSSLRSSFPSRSSTGQHLAFPLGFDDYSSCGRDGAAVNDTRQIHRQAMQGEHLPVFDTAFLLDPDYCFVPLRAYVEPEKPVKVKKEPLAKLPPAVFERARIEGAAKGRLVRSLLSQERAAFYLPTVKEFLQKGMNGVEISQHLDVNETFIHKLLRENGLQTGCRGGFIDKNLRLQEESRRQFKECEAEIREALLTQSVTAVAILFGFNRTTLRTRLRETAE